LRRDRQIEVRKAYIDGVLNSHGRQIAICRLARGLNASSGAVDRRFAAAHIADLDAASA
jgi:hypothetical protein